MMSKVLIVAMVAGAAAAQGVTVVWDEAVDGNLSNDPFSPTDLGTLGAGDNIVRGSTLGPGTPPSEGFDVFSITIADGFTLEGIVMSGYSTIDGTGTSGFNFSTGAAASDLGANILFGPGWGVPQVGGDLFDEGIFGPIDSLGPGTYFMEVREFGGPEANWELTFQVVPTPASAVMLGLGGLVAGRRRR